MRTKSFDVQAAALGAALVAGNLLSGCDLPEDVQEMTATLRAPRGAVTCLGQKHRVTVHRDGTVWASGNGDLGQLGNDLVQSTVPVQVLTSSGPLAGIVGVTCGSNHTLALAADGTVWAWGQNTQGVLGTGNAVTQFRATQVKGFGGMGILTDVTAIATGLTHTVALRSDGYVMAWGGNDDGQLGIGYANLWKPTPEPAANPESVKIIAIAAGYAHTVALSELGEVYTWGNNNHGSLGLNDSPDESVPMDDTFNKSTMTKVAALSNLPGGVRVVDVSAGGSNTLAVLSDGSVRTWGNNKYGQLGYTLPAGDLYGDAPMAVPGLDEATIAVAGPTHMAALDANGSVHTWGSNLQGELASGTKIQRTMPGVALSPAQQPVEGVVGLAVGSQHTTVVFGSGAYASSGANGSGELSFSPQLWPSLVWATAQASPDGAGGRASVAVGGQHSLALTPDGRVYAWGAGAAGQLGEGAGAPGAYQDRSSPSLVAGVGHEAIAISAGVDHSLALLNSGVVVAWGNNASGQLGNLAVGGKNNVAQPVRTANGAELTGVSAISGGHDHGLALRNGSVWAWGANGSGQLGAPASAGRPWAQPVGQLTQIVSIAACAQHSMALKADGSVWAWGRGLDKQLGNGAAVGSSTPVQVLRGEQHSLTPYLTGVVAIACGEVHSMALTADGGVWTWGRNQFGQLGNASGESATPVRVRAGAQGATALNDVRFIAAGRYASYAITSDGIAWSWGLNNEGELGDGTFVTKVLPAKVALVAGAAQARVVTVAGGLHAVFLQADGTTWTSGSNGHGQLGIGVVTDPMAVPAKTNPAQIGY